MPGFKVIRAPPDEPEDDGVISFFLAIGYLRSGGKFTVAVRNCCPPGGELSGIIYQVDVLSAMYWF